jgi:hypothetical protein
VTGAVTKALTVALLVAAARRTAHAAPAADESAARFVLIVGVNRSVDSELPLLRYADDDAARYQELFRSLGGRTTLLTRADENTRRISPEAIAGAKAPRRQELTRAIAALAIDVAAARARGRQTLFYFVYAGHGNVSGTEAYLALEDARLTGDDIEHDIVDKVHADETHLIIDACYSYFLAYGRGPGGRRREVHGFAPNEGLAHRTDVGLLLSTTSARESHEWEGFQAGIFSHEVRSGLYGAADLDGDGRISYREIAAFVNRANAAIPNERFRPDVFARAPRAAGRLVDLRGGPGRHLRVDGAAQAGHYLFEDTRGVRLADFHNGRNHVLSLLLPDTAGPLYLRRTSDDREFEIPAAPALVNLADLSAQPPRAAARGAAHDAFSLIFSLPFDDEALAAYPASAGDRAVDLTLARDAADAPAPRPRWRLVAGTAALGIGAASAATAVVLTLSAHALKGDAQRAPNQQATAALDDRIAVRRSWATATYAIAAAATLTGGALLLWPGGNLRATGVVDGSSGSLAIQGGF